MKTTCWEAGFFEIFPYTGETDANRESGSTRSREIRWILVWKEGDRPLYLVYYLVSKLILLLGRKPYARS